MGLSNYPPLISVNNMNYRYGRHIELQCKCQDCVAQYCSRSYDSIQFSLLNGANEVRYRQLDRNGKSAIPEAQYYEQQPKLHNGEYIQVASRVFFSKTFVKYFSIHVVRTGGSSVYSESQHYLDLYQFSIPNVGIYGDITFTNQVERLKNHERLR